MDYYLIFGLGMIAQALFSARFIIQLAKSELEGKVVSPVLFWQLSLLASTLLIVYGFLRNDIVIIGGQVVSYYIYIRNLQFKQEWKNIYRPLRYVFLFIPVCFVLVLLLFSFQSLDGLFNNPEIPVLLLTYGSIGQAVFALRFVVQWLHSERKQKSEFPSTFWIISLAGALMIIGYAVMRKDAVLFIGQFFGTLVYSRNLFLHYSPQKKLKRSSVSIMAQLKQYRLLLLSGLIAVALFVNLNDWSVTESTEARYAQVSKEMLESGDYLHPTLMGIKHYHKPLLTYWVTVAGYQLFGVNGFGARFFLQIAIIIQVIIVYGIAKLLLRRNKLAFLAAVLYFALPGVFMSSRALTTDVYLTTFVLLSVFAWFKFALFRQRNYLLLFYLSLGLGFFTKGPVVFIFPAFVMLGGYFAGVRPQKEILYHLIGMVLMVFSGLTWFVYLYLTNQQFLDYFLIRHTVERFATDVFRRSEPWWYFLAIVPAASFPWGLILITRLFRKKITQSASGIIFFMWIVPPILFFSLSSSKLMLYVLPVYAGIAVGAIWAWVRMHEDMRRKWGNIQFVFHLLILGGGALLPFFQPELFLSKNVYYLLIMTTSILIALRFTPITEKEKPVLAAAVFMYGLCLISSHIFEYNPEKVKDTRRVAAFIESELPETQNILIFDRRMPSVQFHTGKNIISLYAGHHSLAREIQFETDDHWKNNLKDLVDTPEHFANLVKPGNVLLVRSKYGLPPAFSEESQNFDYSISIDGWDIYYF